MKKVKQKEKCPYDHFNIIDSFLILPASLNQLAESFLGDQKEYSIIQL
jgi:hypothetical protein